MDDPEHARRVAAIVAAVRTRPPGSLLRAGKAKAHTPYVNLGAYAPAPAASATTGQAGVRGGGGAPPPPPLTSVDVDGLTSILGLHPGGGGTVTCEAGVSMRALCSELLRVGLLPALPVEGEEMTVGGLYTGFGIQATSHAVGLFHDTVTEVEVVTGDGRVLRASADAHADLFALLPGSFGTLGIVTALSLRTMRATPHVRVTATRFSLGHDFQVGMLHALRGVPPEDFIEGYAFSPTCFVRVTASFVGDGGDADTGAVRLPVYDPATQRGARYFHQHVSAVATGYGASFTQATLPFLFRHTRGLWWGLSSYLGAPWDVVVTGTAGGRAWLDDVIAAAEAERSRQTRKDVDGSARGWQPKPGGSFTQRDYARCLVTQGFYVRASRLAHMLECVRASLDVYPVWTCPVRVLPAPGHTSRGTEGCTHSHGRLWQRMCGDGGEVGGDPHWAFDVGTYGVPRARSYAAFATVRALQRAADSPTQWGLSFLTRQEMTDPSGWLNARGYASARQAYGSVGAFPPLQDKVRPYDPAVDGAGGGVIACWRLKRDGVYTHVLLCAAAATVLLLALLASAAMAPPAMATRWLSAEASGVQ